MNNLLRLAVAHMFTGTTSQDVSRPTTQAVAMRVRSNNAHPVEILAKHECSHYQFEDSTLPPSFRNNSFSELDPVIFGSGPCFHDVSPKDGHCLDICCAPG